MSAASEIASRRRLRLPASMRGQLVLGLSLLLAAIAVFLLWYVPAQLTREALALNAEKAEAIGEVTAYSLAAYVAFEDRLSMEEVIAGTRRDDDVLYVVVVDTLGRILAESDLAVARAASFESTDERDPTHTDSIFRIVESIRQDERVIGTVYLGLTLAPMMDRVQASRRNIGGVMALAFALALLGVYAIGSIVTRPLGRIVSVAREISAGNLRRRVGITSHGEVGALAQGFDTMVDRVEAAYAELQELNRDLEQRVAARTEQLRQAFDERLLAERSAHESEERFRTMFESAAVGMMLIGRDFQVLEVNGAFKEMWRGKRVDLVGRHVEELYDSSADGDVPRQMRSLMAGEGDRIQCEIRCLPMEGPDVWGHAVVSPVRDATGEVAFLIAMIENITSQKELAEQLRQSQKLEAIGRLAGGIAHDFNNLLTTINGVSELVLADLDGPAHLRDDIEQVAKAGARAADLTRQLLAFSRRQLLQPRVIDVNAAVQDLAALLLRLIGEDIRLTLQLDPRLPRVKADPGQLGQVVMNLVVNARDAMPTGGSLFIETSAVDIDDAMAARFDTAPGRGVRLSVIDEGCGMDAEVLRNIFEPFFTTKELGRGTGLGLATVYGIVKQSGGGIGVDSTPGVGTSFTILLPATVEAEMAIDTTAAAPLAGTETVLLVEDEQSVRALTARVLRRSGYTVIEHASATEALRCAASKDIHIDAILTDVIMPGLSGPELVSELSRSRPDVKVLFMSGYPRDQMNHPGLEREGFAFVQKPMSPADLTSAVRRLLDGERSHN